LFRAAETRNDLERIRAARGAREHLGPAAKTDDPDFDAISSHYQRLFPDVLPVSVAPPGRERHLRTIERPAQRRKRSMHLTHRGAGAEPRADDRAKRRGPADEHHLPAVRDEVSIFVAARERPLNLARPPDREVLERTCRKLCAAMAPRDAQRRHGSLIVE